MVLAPYTTDSPEEFVGEQLALARSERVIVQTKHGKLTGGRVRNGAQVWLNVPYAEDVPRFTHVKPLPQDFKYDESKEFTKDAIYCAQPRREYAMNAVFKQSYGLGEPNDCPFIADIHVPSGSRFDSEGKYLSTQPLKPVTVFIHGGFLQFGTTSGNHYNQQNYMSETYGEVRVLLGHRVSVLGFLAGDKVEGNFGFEDVRVGLEWVRDNITSFGGDPSRVNLAGLSAGGHIVSQMMHYYARRAPEPAPFKTIWLQSNSVLCNLAVPSFLNPQFDAFCQALSLDPSSPDILTQLRDTEKVPTAKMIDVVESLGQFATFRGVQDEKIVKEITEYQQSKQFADDLKTIGVECVVLGGCRDEDFFYKIIHNPQTKEEFVTDTTRYYPADVSQRLVDSYIPAASATPEEMKPLVGTIIADCQVHLPVRFLARDLASNGFPVVRYEIEYLADCWDKINKGQVTHGTDMVLLHLRLPRLTAMETTVAQAFLATVEHEMLLAQAGGKKPWDQVLYLKPDGSIKWEEDRRWAILKGAEKAVRGFNYEERQ